MKQWQTNKKKNKKKSLPIEFNGTNDHSKLTMLLENEARVGINMSVRSYDRIMFILCSLDWTIILINLKKRAT